MDSQKILEFATKICEVDKILAMLKRGESVRASFDVGGEQSSVMIYINGDGVSTSKMESMMAELKKELERQLLHVARP